MIVTKHFPVTVTADAPVTSQWELPPDGVYIVRTTLAVKGSLIDAQYSTEFVRIEGGITSGGNFGINSEDFTINCTIASDGTLTFTMTPSQIVQSVSVDLQLMYGVL